MASQRIKGLNIQIGGDTTKLSSALKSVDSQLSNTTKHLKDIDRLLKFNPGNAELLKQKQTQLANAIRTTKTRLDELRRAQAQLDDDPSIDKNSEQYQALRREIINTESELKKLQGQADKLRFPNLTALGTKFDQMGQKMRTVGRNLSMYVTTPLLGVGTAAVKTTADFDAQMSKVKAISGSTGGDFDKLRNKAKEMGSKTKFSATEAGEGFEYMAMAGWKTGDMLEGIEPILNLAAASGEELGKTSDIVTDGLTAFGMKAKDAGRFADVMAKASSNANTNVSLMGETFKYVGPVAGSLGYRVEDVAVGIGLMANAGIKASSAGTSLRAGLLRLSAPTKQTAEAMEEIGFKMTDAQGNVKPFNKVLEELRGKFGGLTKAQQVAIANDLFGKNAASGWLAMINAKDADVKKLTKSIENSSGASKDMAKTMQDNLSGALTSLKSKLEGAAITIGDRLTPYIKAAVEKVQEFTDWFNNLDKGTQDVIIRMGLFAAAVGPVIVVLGGLFSSVGKVLTGFSGMVSFAGKIGGVFGGLAGKMAGLNGPLGKFGGMLTSLPGWAGPAALAIGGLVLAADKWQGRLSAVRREYDQNAKSRKEAILDAGAEAAVVEKQKDRLYELLGVEQKSAGQKAEIRQIVKDLNGKIQGLNLKYNEEKDILNQSRQALENKIKAMKKEAEAAAYQEAIKSAYKDRIKLASEVEKSEKRLADYVKKHGEDGTAQYRTLSNEVNRHKDALKKCDTEIDKYAQSYTNLQSESGKAAKSVGEVSAEFTKLKEKAGQAGYDFTNEFVTKLKENAWKVPKSVDEMNNAVAFDKLLSKSKKAGIDVPDSVANQIIEGAYKVPKSTKQMENLVKYDKLVKTASQAGFQVPERIKKALIEGKGKTKAAADELQAYIKWNSVVKRALDAGIKIPKHLKEEIEKGGPGVEKATKELEKKITDKLEKTEDKSEKSGKKIPGKQGKGIKDNKTAVDPGLNSLYKYLKKNLKFDFGFLGEFWTKGMAKGASNGSSKTNLWNSCVSIFNYVTKSIKDIFGINSPAKKIMPFGSAVTEGMAVGITDNVRMIKDASKKMLNAAIPKDAPKIGIDIGAEIDDAVINGMTNKTLSYEANQELTMRTNAIKSIKEAMMEAVDYKMISQAVRDGAYEGTKETKLILDGRVLTRELGKLGVVIT